MPSKNTIKTYMEDGYYHVYNRGVEKRKIFIDEEDYSVFLNFLKLYLSPKENSFELAGSLPVNRLRIRKTFAEEVKLIAFCLMPNHFHLLLNQKTINGMTSFMRAFATSYSMYFNKKYERVGSLFQGPYKAALVQTDEYLLHLSRYIHLNPKELIDSAGRDPAKAIKIDEYEYSSYPYYLGRKNANWIDTQTILSYFNSSNEYEKFVVDHIDYATELEKIKHLTLED